MPSILDKLYQQASETPEKLLYCFLDINGKIKERYSYREFIERTGHIAAHISRSYRINPGDRLLLAYPPGLEMICAFFACVRLGLIPVPVYPPAAHGFQYALYKMTFIAKDCEATAVLTNRTFYWSMKLNLAKKRIARFQFGEDYISRLKWIITTDAASQTATDFNERYSEILFLQYTSGSTNNPKGVNVSHQNILQNCEAVVDHLPIGVSWLPQYHDMGLIGYYIFFALSGGTTYGFSPLDFLQRPALWLETISKYRGTATSAPNFAFEYCLRPDKISPESYSDYDLSSLRFLMTAAEPVRKRTYQKFLETFKPYGLTEESFFAAYGLAEFTLAVSNYGRKSLNLNTAALQNNQVEISKSTSEKNTTIIFSCGKPLGDTNIRIVDPESMLPVHGLGIGEIWISGSSCCDGYWQRPELSEDIFHAKLNNGDETKYLRTGDLGFLFEGELYVCGRLKDMIIIRGLNVYPQDVEMLVEADPHIRKGCVAAFSVVEENEEKLIVVAELKKTSRLPDILALNKRVQQALGITVSGFTFIPPRCIPKTSSGKLIRYRAKKLWQQNKLKVIHQTKPHEIQLDQKNSTATSPVASLFSRYGLTPTDTCSIAEAGLDSLQTAEFLHDLKSMLENSDASSLAGLLDLRFIQKIAICELYGSIESLGNGIAVSDQYFRSLIKKIQRENLQSDQQKMQADANTPFVTSLSSTDSFSNDSDAILLTGGTGFLGPFLLHSLLEQTNSNIYVLVRAADEATGLERLQAALATAGLNSAKHQQQMVKRVKPICGDLSKPQFGLSKSTWHMLAETTHSIYHNGAQVNYLLDYESMRAANVNGTKEIIRLAFDRRPKVLNHISTTFVFGWSVKDVLYESDNNSHMDLLDFGYSQSKWVSEQVVLAGMRQGLKARIFRPALISPSINGAGYNFDIAIRLLAFMVNHGIAVTAKNQVSFTPADVVANNIVAISNLSASPNSTFHVTRSEYASMMDITQLLSRLIGREFEYFDLSDFVPQVIRRCTKDDLLFPLLDFFVRSTDNISAMEFKRYDNQNYYQAVQQAKWGKPDPTLEETVKGLLLFMQNEGIVEV